MPLNILKVDDCVLVIAGHAEHLASPAKMNFDMFEATNKQPGQQSISSLIENGNISSIKLSRKVAKSVTSPLLDSEMGYFCGVLDPF